MNTKLIIKNKQNEILQTCIFHEQETLDAFLVMIVANATFGKPEHTVEVSPRIVDEFGVVTEAVYEVIPSEYIVEQVDVTAEVAQQAINTLALKYLSETDYLILRELDSGVACPIAIKEERAAARLRIV
jgi:hypothetical protein